MRGALTGGGVGGVAGVASASVALAALVGETVMTPSGQANVIYLAVNESSPGSLLLQLCELLATTPLQVKTTPPQVKTTSPQVKTTSLQVNTPIQVNLQVRPRPYR